MNLNFNFPPALLKRLVEAEERQADSLEDISLCLRELLPAPFAREDIPPEKSRPADVDSLSIYGDEEAARDEYKRQREEPTPEEEDAMMMDSMQPLMSLDVGKWEEEEDRE